MRKIICLLAVVPFLASAATPHLAKQKIWVPLSSTLPAPVSFELRSVSLSQLSQLYATEVYQGSYVIDPELLLDGRLVSFRASSLTGDLTEFFKMFFLSVGVSYDVVGGVLRLSLLPVAAQADEKFITVVYTPKHREVGYLTSALAPLLSGNFANRRSIPSSIKSTDLSSAKKNLVSDSQSVTSLIDFNSAEQVIFTASASDVSRFYDVVGKIDVPIPVFRVKTLIYEVFLEDSSSSGVSLAGSILGGRVSASVGDVAAGVFSLKLGGLEIALDAFNRDGRFRLLSAPSALVRAGSHAVLSVGQDVPVLGAILRSPEAGSSQSVEYRSSGVILNVSLRSVGDSVFLDLDQQVSNFANTTTGVNSSPTLTKRSVQSSLVIKNGDVTLLGGLSEDKMDGSKSGASFLPSWLSTVKKSSSRSEILFFLQVVRVE